MERLVIVPDEQVDRFALQARLRAIAGEVKAENLAYLMGEQSARVLLNGMHATEKQEVLVWGRSDRSFLVSWTSLTPLEEVAGVLASDHEEGLVSQVFESGQTVVQNADELRGATWTNLTEIRGRAIGSMAGAPVSLFGRPTAVLTLVGYREGDAPGYLSFEDAARLTRVASLLARLLEDRLIRAALGLETL
jgi:hypothetical protein